MQQVESSQTRQSKSSPEHWVDLYADRLFKYALNEADSWTPG